MTNIFSEKTDNSFSINLDKEIYSSEAVIEAAHTFSDKCAILVESGTNNKLRVNFTLFHDTDSSELEKISLEFRKELVEQQLRVKLEARFGNMRELIVRQAFLPVSNLNSILPI